MDDDRSLYRESVPSTLLVFLPQAVLAGADSRGDWGDSSSPFLEYFYLDRDKTRTILQIRVLVFRASTRHLEVKGSVPKLSYKFWCWYIVGVVAVTSGIVVPSFPRKYPRYAHEEIRHRLAGQFSASPSSASNYDAPTIWYVSLCDVRPPRNIVCLPLLQAKYHTCFRRTSASSAE